jgi:hypothetical protein
MSDISLGKNGSSGNSSIYSAYAIIVRGTSQPVCSALSFHLFASADLVIERATAWLHGLWRDEDKGSAWDSNP